MNTHNQSETLCCPFCLSTKHKRNGHSNNHLQRYRCKSCGRTFSKRTGTVFHSLKKENSFRKYAEKMKNGYFTLKQLAGEFQISVSTAFYWRHKILTMVNNNDLHKSIVELLIMKTRFNVIGQKNTAAHFLINNQKHLCNLLISSDYSKNSMSRIIFLSVDKTNPKLISSNIISPFGNKNVVPISNCNSYLFNIFKAFKLQYKLTRVCKDNTSNPIKIETVPNISNVFKTLILQKTRGVSGKYLNHYGNWIATIIQFIINDLDIWCFNNNSVWYNYILTEKSFFSFMHHQKQKWYIKTDNRFWKSEVKFKINRMCA